MLGITSFLACDTTNAITAQENKTSINKINTSIADPLPSWNAGKTKDDIIAFVKAVTTEGTDQFVKVEDRIAAFDNDGTLWAEQPDYFLGFKISG